MTNEKKRSGHIIPPVGENMEKLRKALKLSQEAVAEQMGVTQASVSAWECGIAVPRTDKLPKLAKVLGCRVEDLFERVDER